MKTYVFDIDGTICKKQKDEDYSLSLPIVSRIKKINKLFDAGNKIIFFTARGMGRNYGDVGKCYKEFYDLTNKQLVDWRVKYHKLILGKPSADIYVDDKGIQDIKFFESLD